MQTLATLFTAYLADVSLAHAPSTHYQQAKFYGMILRRLGPLPLIDCTPEVVRAWKADLAARYSRSTVHKYLSFLSQAFTYAVDCEWLTRNPFAKMRKPSPGRGRLRFLSEAERERLLIACRMSRNPVLYPLVLLALATGGRKNELRCLCWSEVDLEAGVVRFVKTKTYLDRSVPVVGEALDALTTLAQKRRPGVGLVFARADGRKPREIECAWATVRHAAQLEDFRFHDLRHTYASYLAMSGASLQDISTLLGHTKVNQSYRYIHLMPSHTRGVVERMAQKYLT